MNATAMSSIPALQILSLLALAACGSAGSKAPNSSVSLAESAIFGEPPAPSIAPSATIQVLTEEDVRYHTLGFFGEGIPAHIVESPSGVVLVDLSQGDGTEVELRAYVDAIGKPMSVIITHGHFDHWLGASAFTDIDLYASTGVATALESSVGNTAGFTDIYASGVNAVDGSVTLAGFNFEVHDVPSTETDEVGYITLPDQQAIFSGDLATGKSHEYLREYTPNDGRDELDTWLSALESMKSNYSGYRYIFYGHHGYSTDVAGSFDGAIDYVSTGQALIKGTQPLSDGGTATSVQQVVDELLVLYPAHHDGGLYFALPDAFYPGDPGAEWF